MAWKGFDPEPSLSYLEPVVHGLLDAPPLRLLDVGCGNGVVSTRLSEVGYEVTGIDPSVDGIALARRDGSGRYEVDNASPGLLARLGGEPFDAVVSLEVVEHVYDPPAWASACFEALRPGGRLVCSTPYHGYAKNLALAASGRFDTHWHPLRVGGHIKFWSRDTLSQLLQSAGFRVEGFHGAGRLPFLWKSMVMNATRP
jgi:2-polyprenyl-6-hydroxyphenyl methylase/3-demethylubiquinone-9 3-methyltransferase